MSKYAPSSNDASTRSYDGDPQNPLDIDQRKSLQECQCIALVAVLNVVHRSRQRPGLRRRLEHADRAETEADHDCRRANGAQTPFTAHVAAWKIPWRPHRLLVGLFFVTRLQRVNRR